MNIRDMENEDGERRGLIDVKVADSLLDDERRAWRFSVTTGQDGGKQVVIYWERGDVMLYHDDVAILCVVAARLWVLGKNAKATLPDGRAFSDIGSDELWRSAA